MKRAAALLLGLLSLSVPAAAEQKDDPKCKDHQLFTRMPGSWTTMNFHGWRPKDDGVRTSDSSMASQVPAGILREASNFLVA